MPLVSPQLLADPADMAEMIEGQRFFLRVFQTSPMKQRIDRICMPSPDDFSDSALAEHCRRMVKTNFHPSGTCRMGARRRPDGRARPEAAGARRRGAEGLRSLRDARHQRRQHQCAGADVGRPLRRVRQRGRVED